MWNFYLVSYVQKTGSVKMPRSYLIKGYDLSLDQAAVKIQAEEKEYTIKKIELIEKDFYIIEEVGSKE